MTRQPIHYAIRPLDARAHLFEVLCTVPDPDPQGQRALQKSANNDHRIIADMPK